MREKAEQRSLMWPLVGLIFTFLLVVGLVGRISGEFPINDDWAYSLPVQWAHRWSIIRFTNWQYMTLIGQTVLGWLWVTLFGFSYLALRMLTLLVAAGGLIALFLLSRLVIGNERIAAVLTLSWAVNPIFLASAVTFMTDIYFWAAVTGAVLLLFMSLERGQSGYYIFGWALALLAMSIRQMAIAIPIGFFVADWARNGWSFRLMLRSGLPFVALVLFLFAYTRIVAETIGLPTQFPIPMQQLKIVMQDMLHLHPGAFLPTFWGVITGSLYLGLFSLPIASLAVAKSRIGHHWAVWIIAVAAFALVVVTHRLLPLAGNTLQTWGLGPRVLVDTPPPAHAAWFAYLLSAVACYSYGVLSVLGAKSTRSFRSPGKRDAVRELALPLGLIVIAAVAYAPLIMIYGPWFDRHMLLTAPLLLVASSAIAFGRVDTSGSLAVPLTIIFCIGLASIALVHDFFAWQRARWSLIAQATRARQIAPLQIDGGFEYNNLMRHPDRPGNARMPAPLLGRPNYARCFVSQAQITGYKPLDQIEIDRWLPLGSPSLTFGCKSEKG